MASIMMRMPISNKAINHLSASKPHHHGTAAALATARKPSCFVFRCSATAVPCEVDRRSGNYKPSVWDFDFVQSLDTNSYKGEKYLTRASMLREQVKLLLEQQRLNPADQQLDLIDDLYRLGISYLFDGEIEQILTRIYEQNYGKNYVPKERDLYSTALEFRLLRQHGFNVPQDVFDRFNDEMGDFNAILRTDTKGLLQLYEASFMLTEGENTLERARDFATPILQKYLNDHHGHGTGGGENLSLLVSHALDLPLHWTCKRPYASWFIHAYEKRPDMNPVVLELAKLDFNIVQEVHREELKHVSRWWKQTGLSEVMPFARDRIVECYFWNSGGRFEPQYGYSRIVSTKVNILITVMDDIFDVYGTFEELHAFSKAIQRWDVEGIHELPKYMQMTFLALNNFITDVAYDVLREHGVPIIHHLRKTWGDLFESYMHEVTWYSTGYTPKLGEYIGNAWITVGGPIMLTHNFFGVKNPMEMEAVQRLYEYRNNDLVRWAATILRLTNDQGTSPDEMKRGDVPKAIQCYMHENGASSEEAQEHIRLLIQEAWKKLNTERAANSTFPESFVRSAIELGRMGHCMYKRGDGLGAQNNHINDLISKLTFEPIV